MLVCTHVYVCMYMYTHVMVVHTYICVYTHMLIMQWPYLLKYVYTCLFMHAMPVCLCMCTHMLTHLSMHCSYMNRLYKKGMHICAHVCGV